ncbi:hypothetical protein PGT21_024222 [Puccinia graminis f. sp. tritici]|uniref:Uncharacterized protein n=1 Tax=Puccinia graminis f. sp. tritici TaxID=56615 RepID=A0A5B0M6J3_PUCGR|nr:hypothetical protein PGT21_024222 [Puccinia graminis f. sp. tritici]
MIIQFTSLVLSHTDHSKATPVKTYSEAVLASEETRSEPNKTAKAAPRKPKKQFKSPEEVPSEWDESNLSSKSETRKTAATVVKKPVKSASRSKTLTSNGPIPPPAILAEQPESTEKSQATAHPTKKKPTVPAKSNDLLPITDPFKSNEKPSKLIDKDSISHLSFKKLDREPLAKTANNAAETSIDQAPRKKEAAVRVDSLSEAAKTLLNGPGTFKEPIDRSTQKSLANYFVPQGRTVRSISS